MTLQETAELAAREYMPKLYRLLIDELEPGDPMRVFYEEILARYPSKW